MVKKIFLAVCFLSIISYAQIDTSLSLNYTGQMQHILDYSSSFNQYIGKTEFGLFVKYKRFIGTRLIFKVYSDYSVKPFDAYLFFKPNEQTEIKLGQFASPFSYENLLAPYKRDFIDESKTTKYLSTRDYGVGGEYNGSLFELRGALINGEGLNQKDKNTKKDFVVNVEVKPFKNLLIGGSYYAGKAGPDSSISNWNFRNFHISYIDAFKYKVYCEYSSINQLNYSNKGFYSVLGCFIPPEYIAGEIGEVVLRYEYQEIYNNKKDNNSLILGVNYFLRKDYLFKIQMNYVLEDFLESNASGKLLIGAYYSFN